MSKLVDKWKKMPLRARAMIVVATVMAGLVAAKYIEPPDNALPLPGVIERAEADLAAKLDELERLTRLAADREKRFARLKSKLMPHVWRMRGKVPSTEFQSEVDRLAREARVTIQTMGSHRVDDVNDHFRAVEVTVNFSGSMKEVSAFMQALEKSRAKCHWRSCRIRPINVRDSNQVSLSGRLQAFFYTDEAEKQLFATDDEK